MPQSPKNAQGMTRTQATIWNTLLIGHKASSLPWGLPKLCDEADVGMNNVTRGVAKLVEMEIGVLWCGTTSVNLENPALGPVEVPPSFADRPASKSKKPKKEPAAKPKSEPDAKPDPVEDDEEADFLEKIFAAITALEQKQNRIDAAISTLLGFVKS